MSPLVSVITPTWQRHKLLLNHCIPSVQAQTYTNVEHIVVSDGPDPQLRELLPDSVRYAELDHWDPEVRWGVRARLLGIEMARGQIIAYLDDDNMFRPDHLTVLVQALRGDPFADFAYSRMFVHRGGYEVGAEPPVFGQIDTSLLVHRRHLLDLATWRNSLPTIDWDLVLRWLVQGARWVFVSRITVDYGLTE